MEKYTDTPCAADGSVPTDPVRIHGYALCATCMATLVQTGFNPSGIPSVARVRKYIDNMQAQRAKLGLI